MSARRVVTLGTGKRAQTMLNAHPWPAGFTVTAELCNRDWAAVAANGGLGIQCPTKQRGVI